MKRRNWTTFGSALPVLLAGLISSPAWAALAGKLVAWGANEFGQSNVPPGDDFVAISAGAAHSSALRSDGSLAGWGSNFGDAGLGSADVFYGQAIVPAGNDFKAIAAGAFHSLALRTDGSLVGWGSNDLFGNGPNPTGQATAPAGRDFVAIAAAAGGFHSLALKSDGSLASWGDNSEGQTNVPAGNDFVTITAGWGQSLALRSDGSMVGWGWNYGIDATAGTYYGQAVPRPGTNFIALAAGERFSVAIQVQPPALTIEQMGNSIVLSWSTNHSGYTLETKTDVSSLLNWSNVPGTPTSIGNQFVVTNNVASGNQFFRLKR
jgi:alpha-tubulin suppressor-like RCC1 family protein